MIKKSTGVLLGLSLMIGAPFVGLLLLPRALADSGMGWLIGGLISFAYIEVIAIFLIGAVILAYSLKRLL